MFAIQYMPPNEMEELEELNIDESKIMPCNRRNFNIRKYIFHISFGFICE
jgi:hypothetical protein